MEPFDAILENLERAQRRGIEAVTNRLDFVVETLEDLVRDVRASVQEAVPADADELFPLGEARDAVRRAEEAARGWAEEVERLRGRVEELEARAAVPAGPSLELLRELDAARSQKDLLHALLPVLRRYAGRAVVLVLREGRVSAWSGIGLTDAERLRLWSGEAAASPVLTRLAEEGVACRFAPSTDPVFSTWLAGEPPAEEALLVPVALRGRVVGGIYLDRVEGEPWEPATAQSLVALACWLIDTLPHRPQSPSPPLTEPVQVGEPAPAPVEPVEEPTPPPQPAVAETGAPEAAPAEEPTPPPQPAVAGPDEAGTPEVGAPVEEAVAPSATAEAEAPTAEPSAETPAAEAGAAEEAPSGSGEATQTPGAPGFDPSATMRVDVAGAGVEPPPVEPVAPPPPAPEAPAAEETAEIPPEMQPAHEEARRFARLLVSEIKLYNEEEVERGRQSGDIYQRLKEDIDRSREMYEQRVPEEVRRVRDYFREELVRILADGDPDLLGM